MQLVLLIKNDLNYDYSNLCNRNDRYNFTIDNYIKQLIEEVRNADFAYISNVCVDENYRGRKIGTQMLLRVIEIYKDKLFKEIVLADNNVAIKLYKNLGFEQSSENFKVFNAPSKERPNVFTMKNRLLN